MDEGYYLEKYLIGKSKPLIVVDSKENLLTYYEDNYSKSYPVGLGKPLHETPKGKYTIVNKVFYPRLEKSNEYGKCWLGLSKKNYGIHGTNNPNSIGKNESLGCIRMNNGDIVSLYKFTKIGVPVIIK